MTWTWPIFTVYDGASMNGGTSVFRADSDEIASRRVIYHLRIDK